MTIYPPSQVPSGRVTIEDREYMLGPQGEHVPVSVVKPHRVLEDDLVRNEISHAIALSDQLTRFVDHFYANLGAFEDLLGEKYGAKLGGAKGNKTLTTHDGLFKITVRIADNISFGPELQIAKALVDECLIDWTSDARDELKVIVTRAFNTDKEGQINRAALHTILSWEIADERWQRGMQAIRDAMRIVGSKSYVRFYRRPAADAAWEAVTIDLAQA